MNFQQFYVPFNKTNAQTLNVWYIQIYYIYHNKSNKM